MITSSSEKEQKHRPSGPRNAICTLVVSERGSARGSGGASRELHEWREIHKIDRSAIAQELRVGKHRTRSPSILV